MESEVLTDLMKGNERFVIKREVRRLELLKCQRPKAVVITCSDSRVCPEFIFDQDLGDLFVVRTAGNVLGTDTIASVEYAIVHLGVRLIIILGHDDCGAIKACSSSSCAVGHIKSLTNKIRSYISGSQDPIAANATSVMHYLLSESTVVSKAVDEKRCGIVVARYQMTSGRVHILKMEGYKKDTHPTNINPDFSID